MNNEKVFLKCFCFSIRAILSSIPIFAISVHLYFSISHCLNKCFCEEYEYESSLIFNDWHWLTIYDSVCSFKTKLWRWELKHSCFRWIHLTFSYKYRAQQPNDDKGLWTNCWLHVHLPAASLGMMSCGQNALN